MAQFLGTFFSDALVRSVSITAIIPSSSELKLSNWNGDQYDLSAPKRTIYLLHGWLGSHTDWLLNTRISELAIKYNVAIVLPSGENSFYVDHPDGTNYGQYIGEELVNTTRELFGLSTQREDTWIAGLSMGGYGALRNGIHYSETFSKVAAFSSRILSKREAPNREKLGDETINKQLKAIIGSDTLADLSAENDPYDLVLNLKNELDIFIACGFEDDILEENREFHQYLLEQSIPHIYHETDGGHDWDFWNEYIEKAVKWMIEGN